MDSGSDDRSFAEVAGRFAAWQAAQAGLVERAWHRAGFHLLYAPFSTPRLFLPSTANAARGARPAACLPPWAERAPADERAKMLGELVRLLATTKAGAPWAALFQRVLLQVTVEEGRGA